jgi:hypothetical protein
MVAVVVGVLRTRALRGVEGWAHSAHRARLEDDDRRLLRASCGVSVEVVVQFAPTLP